MKRNRNTSRRRTVLLLIFVALAFYAVRSQGLFYSGLFPKVTTPVSVPQEIPKTDVYRILDQWSFNDALALKPFEEKIFKGRTRFEIKREGAQGYLGSASQDACSGLYVKTNREAVPDLWINWKWRVKQFPVKKKPDILSNRAEDDFAARVYVIFLAKSFFRSNVIEYIWDEKLVEGTTADSPYSDRIKLVVVRSGASGEGEGAWKQEMRNVYKDHTNLFGKPPKDPVGMIALMSDSDNTQSSASADFADIVLKLKRF